MLKLSGLGNDLNQNKKKLEENILNGKGYNKFVQLVQNQNGDIAYLEDLDKFPKAKYIENIYACKEGYISKIPAKSIGKIACYLGAGREKKEDIIDNTVGIVLKKKVGEYVKAGEIIAEIYANDIDKMKEAIQNMNKVVEIAEEKVKMDTILKVIY